MITRSALLQETLRALEAAGIEDARRNTEWMLTKIAGCSRSALYAYPEEEVRSDVVSAMRDAVRRRAGNEPLQYILGEVSFYGLSLKVTPDVLIPRPETEQLVEWVLTSFPAALRFLDAGTGSGCIALALKAARPGAFVAGCDVSTGALEVARENASSLGLDVPFFPADLLQEGFSVIVPGRLDILISNPPYVPRSEAASLSEEVRDHEPHLALFVEDDPLLFYRALAEHGRRLLVPGGSLCVEAHADHARSVAVLLTMAGYEEVTVRQDYAGLDRIVSGTIRP